MGLGDLKPEEGEEEEETQEAEVIEVADTEPLPTSAPEPQNSLVRPVEDIKEVAKLYKQFEEIKSELLSSGDTTSIQGNIHVNKSGWRKIATAFNLSVEIVDQELWEEDGIVKARVLARATAPNGKTSTEVAMCASNESNHMEAGKPDDGTEPKDHPDYIKVDGKWRRLKDPREVNEHNILATAATRAKNRAISDCVGGGEVSAEEMTADDVIG